MKNRIINLIKLRQNVDNNSIDMFHACLEYNAKQNPIVKSELVKWPIYLEYWEYLNKQQVIKPFLIETTVDKIHLSGDFITSPFKNHNNDKVIFLLHGITNTRFWIFKQAYVFLKAGYNVVWYDARNHGQSDAAATTFGKKESKDLQDVINYIASTYPQFQKYILYGFSLGAATILIWGKLLKKYLANEKVKLIMCDSAFAHMEKTYSEKVSDHTYLPTTIMVNLLRRQARKHLGTQSLKSLETIKYLKYFHNIPAIFIHGKDDRFVIYTNSEELYQEKIRHEHPIRSRIYLIEHATHGQSFLVGDNETEIYNEYSQEYNQKLSDSILDFIEMHLQ